MNKVFTVNLGGYPFTIDEDAFEYLDKYLKAIHKHFRGGDGYEEITGDIESRLAELFQESLGNRPIVTIKDVTNAISTMGRPEDFGADTLEDEPMSSGKSDFVFKTGKRLFRDPEEEVVAGVCSGIAAYFGIADPLWIRIAFIVFTLFGGSGILLYAVLWAILPKAETAGDYLAMRGEPINVDNISKIIKDEFENLSEKVSEFGEEFGSKKKVAEKRKKVMEQLPLRNGFLF